MVADGINSKFLNNETGAYAAAGARDMSAGSAESMAYSPGSAAVDAASYFCGQSGLNPAPNPGNMDYETVTLTCSVRQRHP